MQDNKEYILLHVKQLNGVAIVLLTCNRNHVRCQSKTLDKFGQDFSKFLFKNKITENYENL